MLVSPAFIWRNFEVGIGGEKGWKVEWAIGSCVLLMFPVPFALELDEEADREGGAPDLGATCEDEVERPAFGLGLG
jgi:hypothetical protein